MSREFVDAIVDGNNIGAEEVFKTTVGAKVGDALENRRKEMAQSMFKAQQGEFDEAPHNEPKPEIADTGTFAPDGSVINNTKETQIDMDLRDENDK